MNAMDLFQKSLQTLTSQFPIKALNLGVDAKQIVLHKLLLEEFDDGSGHGQSPLNLIEKFVKKKKLESEWVALKKIKLSDGMNLIEDLSGQIYIKNVHWNDFSENKGGSSNDK